MALGRRVGLWQRRSERIGRLRTLLQREATALGREENQARIRDRQARGIRATPLSTQFGREEGRVMPRGSRFDLFGGLTPEARANFANQRNEAIIAGLRSPLTTAGAPPLATAAQRIGTPAALSLITPLAPETGIAPIDRNIRPLTSPLGLYAGAVAPGLVLGGTAGALGGSALGGEAERLGAPRDIAGTGIGTRGAAELLGGVVGGGLEAAAGRRALQATGRNVPESLAALRANPEFGGTRFGGSEFDAAPISRGELRTQHPELDEAWRIAGQLQDRYMIAQSKGQPGTRLRKAWEDAEAKAASLEARIRDTFRLAGSEESISNAGGEPPGTGGTGVAEPPEPRQGPSLAGITRNQSRAEATGLKPGKVTQIPGVSQVMSFLANPRIRLPDNVATRWVARSSARAEVMQNYQDVLRPLQGRLLQAWNETPPTYIGPADNPFKNTIKDFADNPEFYQTPAQLRMAADEFAEGGTRLLGQAKDEYGIDVGFYSSGKPGAFYLPTMLEKQSAEALARELPSPTSTAVSKRAGVTKTRAYEGAYQRWKATGETNLETDLNTLVNTHTNSIAGIAGNSTFRHGLGKTRLEVIQELHPKMYAKMTTLRQRLTSLRSTLGRLNERSTQAIDDFLASDDPDLAELADSLDIKVGGAGRNAGKGVRDIQAEIDSVRQQIREMRTPWETAGTGKYHLNNQTFRYHEAAELKAINQVLKSEVFGGEVLDVVDEVRLFRFGGDISPFSIQGAIGLAGHVLTDPIAFAKTFPRAMAEFWSPGGLDRLLAQNPDEALRFARSRGRPAGQQFPEIYQPGRGVERIPGAKVINERAIAALEYINYQMWRADSAFGVKWGGKTQEVADAEAANFLSKLMPGLNPAERGVSAARGKVERAPLVSFSFTAAPGLIVKDATSGMAKLAARTPLRGPKAAFQSLSGREQLAIVRGATLVGTLSSMSVAAWTAKGIEEGKSPEDAAKWGAEQALNPDKSNRRFLSLAIPGTDYFIPVGGPFRSFAIAMVPQKKEIAGETVYIPFAGAPNYIKARITPAITTPRSLLRNRDYEGDPIMTGSLPEQIGRGVWFGLENTVAPLTLSAPSEKIRKGEVDFNLQGAADLFTEAGTHFAGQDAKVPTTGEERTEAISGLLSGAPNPEVAAQAGRPKHELDIDALLYIEDNPEVKALSDKIDERQRNRGDIGQQATDQVASERAALRAKQDELDAGFNSGLIDAEDYVRSTSDLQSEAWARSDQVYKTLGIEFADPSKSTPIKAALDAYFNVELRRVNGVLDWDGFEEGRKAALSGLSKSQKAAAEEYLSRNKTETEKKLEKAGDLRNQYYDLDPWLPSVKNQDKLQEVHDGVEELRLALADQGRMDIPSDALYGEFLRQNPEYRTYIKMAYNLRPGTNAASRYANPKRTDFLIKNREAIMPFFPELFSVRIRAEASGEEPTRPQGFVPIPVR